MNIEDYSAPADHDSLLGPTRRNPDMEHRTYNFETGSSNVNNIMLNTVGVRGKEQKILYAVIIVSFLLIIINIFVTVMLLVVLKITGDGSAFFQFLPNTVIFLADITIPRLFLTKNNSIKAPLGLEIHGNPIELRTKSSRLIVSSKQVTMLAEKGLNIMTNDGKLLMNFDDEKSTIMAKFTYTKEKIGFKSPRITVSKLTSGVSPDNSSKSLKLRGSRRLFLTSSNNLTLRSNSTVLRSKKKDIILKTSIGQIDIEGKKGIRVNLGSSKPVGFDPTAKVFPSSILCICGPQSNTPGKLYTLHNVGNVEVTCDLVLENPCE